MKNRNWNMWTITISVSAVLLLLVQFNAANPGKITLIVLNFLEFINGFHFLFFSIVDPTISSELKCYSCDPNTCTGCEWKRTEPKVCILNKNTKYVHKLKVTFTPVVHQFIGEVHEVLGKGFDAHTFKLYILCGRWLSSNKQMREFIEF